MRWIRSLAGDLRYIGWGPRPQDLIGKLDYLTGRRASLEQWFVRSPFSRTASQRPIPSLELEQLWSVADALESSRGMLLYTGWYKESLFVGPVQVDNAVRFIKVLRSSLEADRERDRSAVAARLVPDHSVLYCLEAERVGVSSVAYPAVDRSRASTHQDATAIGLAIYRAAPAAATRDPRRLETADAVLAAADRITAADRDTLLTALVGSDTDTQSHGDVTPWNVVVDPTGRLALIDYDSVARRPAGFDLAYALTHPSAVAGHAIDGKGAIDELVRCGLASGEANRIVRASLSHSVVEHLQSAVVHSDNRDRTIDLATRKLVALREL